MKKAPQIGAHPRGARTKKGTKGRCPIGGGARDEKGTEDWCPSLGDEDEKRHHGPVPFGRGAEG